MNKSVVSVRPRMVRGSWAFALVGLAVAVLAGCTPETPCATVAESVLSARDAVSDVRPVSARAGTVVGDLEIDRSSCGAIPLPNLGAPTLSPGGGLKPWVEVKRVGFHPDLPSVQDKRVRVFLNLWDDSTTPPTKIAMLSAGKRESTNGNPAVAVGETVDLSPRHGYVFGMTAFPGPIAPTTGLALQPDRTYRLQADVFDFSNLDSHIVELGTCNAPVGTSDGDADRIGDSIDLCKTTGPNVMVRTDGCGVDDNLYPGSEVSHGWSAILKEAVADLDEHRGVPAEAFYQQIVNIVCLSSLAFDDNCTRVVPRYGPDNFWSNEYVYRVFNSYFFNHDMPIEMSDRLMTALGLNISDVGKSCDDTPTPVNISRPVWFSIACLASNQQALETAGVGIEHFGKALGPAFRQVAKEMFDEAGWVPRGGDGVMTIPEVMCSIRLQHQPFLDAAVKPGFDDVAARVLVDPTSVGVFKKFVPPMAGALRDWEMYSVVKDHFAGQFGETYAKVLAAEMFGRYVGKCTNYVQDAADAVWASVTKAARVTSPTFAPLWPVKVLIHSRPTVVTELTADSTGTLNTSITLPPGIEAGTHTIELSGFDESGRPVSRSLPIVLDSSTGNVRPSGVDRALKMGSTTAELAMEAIDPEGDAISWTVKVPPAHGAAQLSGATLTYTPAAGFVGTDYVLVAPADAGGEGDAAIVTFTVAAATCSV